MLMNPKNRVDETFEELDEEIKSLEKYENQQVKDLIEQAEIVFMDEHICNDNLKVRDKDEFLLEPEKVIKDNEDKKITMKQLRVVRLFQYLTNE